MTGKLDIVQARQIAKEMRDTEIAAAEAAAALAQTKYEEKIRAIELVAEILANAVDVPPSVASPADKRRRPDGPSAAVRQAIQAVVDQQGDFTMPEVHDWVRLNLPESALERTAVSNVLNKLKDRNEIHIVIPGAGNKPAVWTVGAGPAPDEQAQIVEESEVTADTI